MQQYVWLIGSLGLLFIWLFIYLSLKEKVSKREMLTVSFWTSFLGLTEPIFVPEYWNPPSLFDLAQKTGFDVESLIFAFAIGGIVVAIYEMIFRVKHKKISINKDFHSKHKIHLVALVSPVIIFLLLLTFTSLNPIYSTSIALLGGGIFTWYCRPDLIKKMIASALIFSGVYFLFFLVLIYFFPGFVVESWNLKAISGILLLGVPVEEILFAFSVGFLWSSLYEHIKWYKIKEK